MSAVSCRAARTGLLATALLCAGMTSAWSQSLDWQPVAPKDPAALTYALAIGSEEHLPLYACRAQAGGGVHPGRYRSDFSGCHIGFAGKEISVAPFEVLSAVWQDATESGFPPHIFRSGSRVQLGGTAGFALLALYPCRAAYQGSYQVGEVAPGDRGCSFGFGGRQVTEHSYQMLQAAPWMTWIAGIAHQIPPGAVPGGLEGGELFYVCRASDQSGLHSGKVKPSSPGCSIASDGKELVLSQFSVLVPKWLAGNAGTLPVAALPVGNEKQELLYLCRAQIRDSVQIGKFTEQLASCHVGMVGGEIASQSYDILSEQ